MACWRWAELAPGGLLGLLQPGVGQGEELLGVVLERLARELGERARPGARGPPRQAAPPARRRPRRRWSSSATEPGPLRLGRPRGTPTGRCSSWTDRRADARLGVGQRASAVRASAEQSRGAAALATRATPSPAAAPAINPMTSSGDQVHAAERTGGVMSLPGDPPVATREVTGPGVGRGSGTVASADDGHARYPGDVAFRIGNRRETAVGSGDDAESSGGPADVGGRRRAPRRDRHRRHRRGTGRRGDSAQPPSLKRDRPALRAGLRPGRRGHRRRHPRPPGRRPGGGQAARPARRDRRPADPRDRRPGPGAAGGRRRRHSRSAASWSPCCGCSPTSSATATWPSTSPAGPPGGSGPRCRPGAAAWSSAWARWPPPSGAAPPTPSPSARSTGASHVDDLDDELDDLHVTLTAELVAGTMPLPGGHRAGHGGPLLRALRRPRRQPGPAHGRPGGRRARAGRRSGAGLTRGGLV